VAGWLSRLWLITTTSMAPSDSGQQLFGIRGEATTEAAIAAQSIGRVGVDAGAVATTMLTKSDPSFHRMPSVSPPRMASGEGTGKARVGRVLQLLKMYY